jgi:hypothetical protein
MEGFVIFAYISSLVSTLQFSFSLSYTGPKILRPITLLNVAYKIFAIILNQRLVDIAGTELGDYQSGFRPNRSTVDIIFMIRQIIEKCYEYNVAIHNVFI